MSAYDSRFNELKQMVRKVHRGFAEFGLELRFTVKDSETPTEPKAKKIVKAKARATKTKTKKQTKKKRS